MANTFFFPASTVKSLLNSVILFPKPSNQAYARVSSSSSPVTQVQVQSILDEELIIALQAVEVLLGYIDKENISDIWKLVHTVDGAGIKLLFSKIPPGPAFGKIQAAQMNWIINNPSQSADEVKTYLLTTFPEYV